MKPEEYEHDGREPDDTEDADRVLSAALGDAVVDDWMAAAVEGIQCQAPHCDAYPLAERNGRKLCANHRNHYDHGISGEPCDRCGSRHWVLTPNAASHAFCAICDIVVYDESITAASWSEDSSKEDQ